MTMHVASIGSAGVYSPMEPVAFSDFIGISDRLMDKDPKDEWRKNHEKTARSIAFGGASPVCSILVEGHLSSSLRRMVQEPKAGWAEKVARKLNELCNLKSGWDGYHGEPVSSLNASFAMKMLETIGPESASPIQIVPGSSGDVQIEWHTISADLELHVRAPNDVAAWYKNIQTETKGVENFLQADFKIVSEWLREISITDQQIRAAAALRG